MGGLEEGKEDNALLSAERALARGGKTEVPTTKLHAHQDNGD